MKYLFVVLVAFFMVGCADSKDHREAAKTFVKERLPDCKKPLFISIGPPGRGSSHRSIHIVKCEKVKYTVSCRARNGCVEDIYCEILDRTEIR